VTTEQRVLCFVSGKTGYAVPIQLVKEVLAPMKLTRTPGAEPYYKGLANVRGEMISIWDSRIFLGVAESQESENAVIILEHQNRKLGLFVDAVESVQKPSPEQLSSPPAELHLKQTGKLSLETIFHKGTETYLIINVIETFFSNLERNAS
jgi:chemotaxis signal transduction protein